MRTKARWLVLLVAAASVAAVSLLAGCASVCDKNEVEQKANPIADMLKDVQAKEIAEENALKWYGYDEAASMARREGKFVMVDFYAKWCHWCKKLDSDTYSDPRVIEALRADFLPVKVDSESTDKVQHELQLLTLSELADSYGVKSYPSIWFIDKDGNKAKLLDGYLGPDEFLVYLKYIKDGSYKTMEFDEYVKKIGAAE